MKFKHYSFLIFVLGFGCKEEPKETVFTDFCSNIHRNDKLTLTEELQGLAAKNANSNRCLCLRRW